MGDSELASSNRTTLISPGKDPERRSKKDQKTASSTNSSNGIPKKPRKKRKTYSCDVCRKFKTRCDFEPLVGKCHRCNVLKLHCSLTREREDEIIAAIETSSKSSLISSNQNLDVPLTCSTSNDSLVSNPITAALNNRLNKLESNLHTLNSKIDLILMLVQGTNTAMSNSNGIQSKEVSESISDRALIEDEESFNEVGDNFSDEEQESDSSNEVEKEFSDSGKPLQSMSQSSSKKYLNGIKLQEPPLKLIDDIDERLFPTKAESHADRLAETQRPFVIARVNFLKYFKQHEQMCLDLSRDFLVKSHFWIIPGGIKEINLEYVEKHLFITSVFTIIAMGFDENNKYETEQEVIYPLVERFLTNTLTMFEQLTDHDIEAILYCSMFNVSRKSKRHRQMKFNSLVLCNFAINSLLNIIDFHKIKERIFVQEEYSALDLYHLRILNSLSACRLQYSIGYGSFTVQDDMLKDFNNLTAKFPQANFGDDIKISEINLGEIVNNIFLNFKLYFKKFTERFKSSLGLRETRSVSSSRKNSLDAGSKSQIAYEYLVFPELDYWLKNWDELLSKDGGGVLLFAYNFYNIMICRNFLTEFHEEYHNDVYYFKCTLKTIKTYCFTLIDGFLKLPPSLIKGAPAITLHQLVYACLTLCDFLHFLNSSERQQILNLCTKVYWHLNTIGEKLNEATENVGKIIKSLIDTSKRKVQSGNQALLSMSSSKMSQPTTPGVVYNGLTRRPSTSPQSVLSTASQGSGTINGAPGGFTMPDVDQFNSFEDFFQDFFDNLKPTTQNIFSSINSTTQK